MCATGIRNCRFSSASCCFLICHASQFRSCPARCYFPDAVKQEPRAGEHLCSSALCTAYNACALIPRVSGHPSPDTLLMLRVAAGCVRRKRICKCGSLTSTVFHFSHTYARLRRGLLLLSTCILNSFAAGEDSAASKRASRVVAVVSQYVWSRPTKGHFKGKFVPDTPWRHKTSECCSET